MCVCVGVFVKEGTEGGVGGSVSEVHAGAEQSHQLLLIVGDVPLHDLLTGAQEALKRLHVYYCTERRRREMTFTSVAPRTELQHIQSASCLQKASSSY